MASTSICTSPMRSSSGISSWLGRAMPASAVNTMPASSISAPELTRTLTAGEGRRRLTVELQRDGRRRALAGKAEAHREQEGCAPAIDGRPDSSTVGSA